jgi:predicted nucleotidyltransferase
MQPDILPTLQSIEDRENVRVFYCCESGSRAWGFPSQDSDYDARFLYVHPAEWYFSLNVERKRDVIERPIVGELDLNGWDLRKALMLLRKSNPPLIEWLQSPIVYLDKKGVAERLRGLLPQFYSPAISRYHYLHMARGNFRDYLQGETVWLKKYFYVLRPLLAIMWIEQERGAVPTEFGKLVEATVTNPRLKTAIGDLVLRKMGGEELDEGPRIPVISDFISSQMSRLENVTVPLSENKGDVETLNEVFRWAVRAVWGA